MKIKSVGESLPICRPKLGLSDLSCIRTNLGTLIEKDPVYLILRQCRISPAVRSLVEMLGYAGPTFWKYQEGTWAEPPPAHLRYSSVEDKHLFGGLASVFGQSFKENLSRKGPQNGRKENGVYHTRVTGDAFLADGYLNGTLSALSDYDALGISVPRFSEADITAVDWTSNSTDSGIFTTAAGGFTEEIDLLVALDVLERELGANSHVFTGQISGTWSRVTSSNFEYHIQRMALFSQVVIFWKVQYQQWYAGGPSSSNWVGFTTNHSLIIDLEPNCDGITFFPRVENEYPVVADAALSWAVDCDPVVWGSTGKNHAGWQSWRTQLNALPAIVEPLLVSISSLANETLVSPTVVLSSFETRLNTVQAYVDKNRLDLWAGSFYACSNALDTFFTVIKTNHVETISELQSLGDTIPGQSLIRLERSLHGGGVRDASNPHLYNVDRAIRQLDSGKAIADVLSSEYLRYIWGTGPTLAAGLEFITKFDELRRRANLAGDLGTHTLYGSFTLDLDDGFIPHLTGVRVKFSSKMRVRFPTSSLFGLMVSAEQAGGLGRLSNAYKAAAFTFALDWFTSIGTRMRDVEQRLVMLALPISICVHSMKITGSFDTVSGLVPDKSLTYQRYERQISKIAPALRSTKIDFREPPGAPFLSSGALAFQLLK
jgi:hypothetical protein